MTTANKYKFSVFFFSVLWLKLNGDVGYFKNINFYVFFCFRLQSSFCCFFLSFTFRSRSCLLRLNILNMQIYIWMENVFNRWQIENTSSHCPTIERMRVKRGPRRTNISAATAKSRNKNRIESNERVSARERRRKKSKQHRAHSGESQISFVRNLYTRHSICSEILTINFIISSNRSSSVTIDSIWVLCVWCACTRLPQHHHSIRPFPYFTVTLFRSPKLNTRANRLAHAAIATLMQSKVDA